MESIGPGLVEARLLPGDVSENVITQFVLLELEIFKFDGAFLKGGPEFTLGISGEGG